MKFLKILLGSILSIAILIVIAIVALVLFVNPNDYKPQLEQLAARQNVALSIDGNLSWSFYPQLGIRSGKFSVKPPMKNITKPLQFDELDVSVKLLPLLHRSIVVNTITVRGKELSLHDDASGNDTTIKNLLIESRNLNLEEKPFPLSLSLHVTTTKPQRDIALTFTAQMSVDKNITKLLLKDISMQLDDTHLTGYMGVTLGNKPFLNMFLSGSDLNMDRYSPEAEGKKDGLASSTGTKESDFIPASNIQALPGEYQLSFQNLTLQHLVANDFATSIHVSQEGVLTIKQLHAKTYGGDYEMHGTIDARQTLPDVALSMSLKNLQLEPAMKDYFHIDKTFASGDFGFDANIKTQGLKWGQLMQAMNGEFSFASKTITLNKLDLTSSLDQSLLQLLQVKLPKLMSEENKTVLSNMNGKGLIHNGVMDNTSLTATALCTEFNGHGTFDLPSSAVNYHMGITFPSADTNSTCADINKKLKDIAWPVACKGTLADETSKLCSTDKDAMRSIVAKAASKEVGKKLDNKINQLLKGFLK